MTRNIYINTESGGVSIGYSDDIVETSAGFKILMRKIERELEALLLKTPKEKPISDSKDYLLSPIYDAALSGFTKMKEMDKWLGDWRSIVAVGMDGVTFDE